MIDINKNYQTFDGRRVIICRTNADGNNPVVGVVDGMIRYWDANGYYALPDCSDLDLMEITDESYISMSKKYRTRDGHDVELITTNNSNVCSNGYTVQGVVKNLLGKDIVLTWGCDGTYTIHSKQNQHLDLIEYKEEKKMIDLNKKYVTKSGEEVVLYTTSAFGYYPVAGQIKDKQSGLYLHRCWTKDGGYLLGITSNQRDLVEKEITETFNVYLYNCPTRGEKFISLVNDGSAIAAERLTIEFTVGKFNV